MGHFAQDKIFYFPLLNNFNNENVIIEILGDWTQGNEVIGIDNIYIGNIKIMYELIKKFNFELDDILSKNNDTINQEKLVFRINSILFD